MIWKLLRPRGKRVLLLLGLFIILTSGFFYLRYINQSSYLLPDKEVKPHYSQTTCRIVSKKLADHRFIVRRYRADFLVSYTVSHIQYRRWVSGNGLDKSYFSDASAQEDILSRYHVGGNYPCYYNPQDPEMAVLVLRHDWGSMFPVIAVSAILLLTFYYFLKHLRILFRSAPPAIGRKGKNRKV